LPRRHREVLHLRYAEGHPDTVSAQLLGVSVKAFRCRIDRALIAARAASAHLEVVGGGSALR
jgi:DNA-directed RNA polymerase specialized sigma24 family protein